MKVSYLRESVESAENGKFFISKNIFAEKSDNDIHFYENPSNFVAYISHSATDGSLVENELNVLGGIKNIASQVEIAQWLGIKIRDIEPIIKEVEVIKEVERETSETFKLRGMVEVYEKLTSRHLIID